MTAKILPRSRHHDNVGRQEPTSWAGHFTHRPVWRIVMRMFLMVVGVLAWLMGRAVIWVSAESGGPLTISAAGVFAVVAVVSLGCERIIKTLEEMRDGSVTRI